MFKFFAFLLFSPVVFSAQIPVISGPFSTWYSSSSLAAFESAGITFPMNTTTGVGSVSGSSTPYTAQVNTAGVATLQTTLPVSVSPPSGSVPSASNNTSALALAGAGGIAAATLVADVPLGSGTGSLAANLALPALGFVAAAGGAAGMVMGSPLLLGAAAASGVGMAGYQLYQAIAAQGITAAASGVASVSSTSYSGFISCDAAFALVGWTNGSQNCPGRTDLFTHYPAPSPINVNCPVTWWPGMPNGYVAYSLACVSANSSPVATVSPVSDIQLQNAIVAAVSSSSSVALDAARLAIQNGVDIQAAINQSGAQANTNALSLQSSFSQLSSSVDALGNTTAQLARNVVNVPSQPSCGTACAPAVDKQIVTIQNGAPQGVTTVSQAPAIAAAIGAATVAAAQTQTDLCAVHPDALACSNDAAVGDVPLQPLNVKNINTLITPVVFGSASCPAPISIGGGKIFDFSFICGWLLMLRPLILAFAWLAAAGIVFRGRPYA